MIEHCISEGMRNSMRRDALHCSVHLLHRKDLAIDPSVLSLLYRSPSLDGLGLGDLYTSAFYQRC